ncbi:phosphatase PAP2 family protein [Flavobacterium sp. LS1R49]|uniref:Phosphatase PAP2 family protein n=1 Tax=Flavobacterium shii TaxID=2987687 RepID=A0A9X2ZFA1_9FLAO|nr:phosphatase PAP2 family protein [Flavobacterium shii]MCV9928717.1 phosphatase PAP2 family protein [Flavobacterium shii]
MRKSIYFYIFIFILSQSVQSQVKDSLIDGLKYQVYQLPNGEFYTYKKPHLFDFITKLPKDFTGTIKDIGNKENLIALGVSAVTTVALLPADQYLLDQSREIGEKIGLQETARYKNFGPLSNIPPNITSGIYLLGNGTTPLLLSLGFASYGLIKDDYRSLNTASGLIESLAISGVFSQTIKRVTGRQSPAPAIADGNPGGAWNPFPSFKAFASNTPNYDAFPSGHLMTATAALYVIMGNYPEVKWIKPVGYSLITVLGFEMVQGGVHWVSDYPVALVMGYIIGKNIANSKIKKSCKNLENKRYTYNFNASRAYGYNLAKVSVTF